ncbi:MAG: outer membrane beta-barrel protein [Chlorobiaceae bacterium]
MNKIAYGIVIGFLVFTCFDRFADAATMPYVRGSVGLAMLNSVDRDYNAGYALAGAVGLHDGPYRLEAELGYQKNGINNSVTDVSMKTYMANGYIDLDIPVIPVTPFVMAGVGLATVSDNNGNSTAVSDRVLAWTVGVGTGISVAPLVKLDAQYRYFATSDTELTGHTLYSISTHNLLLGLKIGF